MYRMCISGLFVLALLPGVSAGQEASKPASSQANPSVTTQQPGLPPSAPNPGAQAQEGAPLRPFGHDFFQQPATAGAAPQAFPLPPEYRLGPGDRVAVFLLGEEQKNFELTVNVEGKVYVPPAGVITVGGLTLTDFRALLDRRLAAFFSNYTLEVMLLEPKQVQVFVAGEVRQPGKYYLSALQTVYDAVKAAGGPTEKGSLRDVRVYRAGRFLQSVDLYQFLMRDEPIRELYLEMGDRVFVPIAQERVWIEGEVNRPAVFELRPGAEERLSDLIDLAGEFTDYAYLDRIEISRLLEDGSRELIYANYRHILAGDGAAENILLKSEDRVRVYSRLEQIQPEQVTILGEVRRPGRYTLEKNMRLWDLILKAGNLTRSAYLLEAQLARVDPLEAPQIVHIALGPDSAGLESKENPLLEADDQVFIRKIPEWRVGPLVEVRGEVMFPGFYPIVEDTTLLSEVLAQAGGPTEEALLSEARLLRKSTILASDPEYERLLKTPRDQMSDLEYDYLVMRANSQNIGQVVVDFRKLLAEGDPREDVTLRDGDIIEVPRAPGVVRVTGRVARAGGVVYEPGQGLKYYLTKAGGLTYDGDRRRIKVIKTSGEILDDEEVKQFEPGDTIWVPRKPDRNYWRFFRDTVTVAAQLATLYLVIDRAMR